MICIISNVNQHYCCCSVFTPPIGITQRGPGPLGTRTRQGFGANNTTNFFPTSKELCHSYSFFSIFLSHQILTSSKSMNTCLPSSLSPSSSPPSSSSPTFPLSPSSSLPPSRVAFALLAHRSDLRSTLHFLASRGDVPSLRHLFSLFPDLPVDLPSRRLNTALHAAIIQNQQGEVLQFLVKEKGADVERRNRKGYNAVLLAVIHCKAPAGAGAGAGSGGSGAWGGGGSKVLEKLIDEFGATWKGRFRSGRFAGKTLQDVAKMYRNHDAVRWLAEKQRREMHSESDNVISTHSQTGIAIGNETNQPSEILSHTHVPGNNQTLLPMHGQRIQAKNQKRCPICNDWVKFPTNISFVRYFEQQAQQQAAAAQDLTLVVPALNHADVYDPVQYHNDHRDMHHSQPHIHVQQDDPASRDNTSHNHSSEQPLGNVHLDSAIQAHIDEADHIPHSLSQVLGLSHADSESQHNSAKPTSTKQPQYPKKVLFTSSKYLNQLLSHRDGQTFKKLCAVEYHGVSNKARTRKEISESYAILHAIEQCRAQFRLRRFLDGKDNGGGQKDDNGVGHTNDNDDNDNYDDNDDDNSNPNANHSCSGSRSTLGSTTHIELENTFLIDLCSGKSMTTTLCGVLFPPDIDNSNNYFLAVDKLPVHLVPHLTELAQNTAYLCRDIRSDHFFQHLRQEVQRHDAQNKTAILVGMHLCGKLAVTAIDLFQQLPSIKALVLCPCCLPKLKIKEREGKWSAFDTYLGNYQDLDPYIVWSNYLKDMIQDRIPNLSVRSHIDPDMHSIKNCIITAVRV